LESLAFVATTPMTVFVPGSGPWGAAVVLVRLLEGAGEEIPLLVEDLSDRVVRDQRSDDEAVSFVDGRADAGLHRVLRPPLLGGRGARAGADRSLLEVPALCRAARGLAVVGARMRRGAHPEVEDRRRRNDRDARNAGLESDVPFPEETHHAVGGGEAEGAPAGEEDGVHLVHEHPGTKHVGLPRGGRAAVHSSGADGALRREDHRAAGSVVQVGRMSNADARNAGDHAPRYSRGTRRPITLTIS
jgi:hypothetical protein